MMKNITKTCLSTLLTTTGLLFAPLTLPAFASHFHNGWYYSIDASYDSVASNGSGGLDIGDSIYEIYGMAIKEDLETNSIWVGFNSNLPLTGRSVPTVVNGFDVPDGNIGWGDMFFDFSGTGNFQQSIDTGQMCGVRFADTNDSSVESGVYCGITGESVVSQNAGYWHLQSHNQTIVDYTGQNSWMGDYRWNDDYYAPYTAAGAGRMPNVIGSGQKIGDVTIRSQTELEDQGFDLGQFFGEGDNIFGFSFTKPAEMVGDFVATILQECINDGMALLGNFTNPEPEPEPEPEPAPDDGCAVTLSQLEALAPDVVDGEWKLFYDTLSNQWYDPPAFSGYTFTTEGGTVFTQIKDFPCGISTDNSYKIYVGDEIQPIGTYKSGDTVDFVNLFNQGITEFKVVFPWEDPDEIETVFALQLEFGKELGSFGMRPMTQEELDRLDIPEPSATLGLFLLGLFGLKLRRKNR